MNITLNLWQLAGVLVAVMSLGKAILVGWCLTLGCRRHLVAQICQVAPGVRSDHQPAPPQARTQAAPQGQRHLTYPLDKGRGVTASLLEPHEQRHRSRSPAAPLHRPPKRNVRVPDDVWKAAKERANRDNLKLSTVVVSALRQYGDKGTIPLADGLTFQLLAQADARAAAQRGEQRQRQMQLQMFVANKSTVMLDSDEVAELLRELGPDAAALADQLDQQARAALDGQCPPRYVFRGPARGPLASGPGMTVPPCRTDDLGGGVTGPERRRWRR
ncbi:hypothetical protein [Streptomyces sp. NPDC087300]|uniref:hypothetical protein n=1 Tax=Streptomyces sp. NPDC087300 TaxID=3365780 RepID=UPI003817308B